jgi:hypothetical protein
MVIENKYAPANDNNNFSFFSSYLFENNAANEPKKGDIKRRLKNKKFILNGGN